MVNSCEIITPGRFVKLEENSWISAGAEAWLGNTYAGVLVATNAGKYFLSDSSLSACSALNAGDRLKVNVTTSCCDRGQAPCLLGTSKTISELAQ